MLQAGEVIQTGAAVGIEGEEEEAVLCCLLYLSDSLGSCYV